MVFGRSTAFLTVFATLAATPVWAHHPTGGKVPATLWHGLLSGLGHPVIGVDHLAFLLAFGAVAALVPAGWRACVAFVAASMAGVVVHLAKIGLPLAEPLIALTVVIAGALLVIGGLRRSAAVLALGAVAGLLHGYALAESIVGAEPMPLGAYLAGLAIASGTLMTGAMVLTRELADPAVSSAVPVRAAGVLACLLGAWFLYGAVTGA